MDDANKPAETFEERMRRKHAAEEQEEKEKAERLRQEYLQRREQARG